MRVLLALCLLAAASLTAAAQITTPQMASPRGMVGCTIGVTTVTVDYGRPSVNGRTIWGDLVPYDAIWRAGANENTVFTASTDITVNGKPLPAGTYGLHMIPTTGAWTLIFNSDHQAWGSYFYNKANDVLRVQAMPSTGPHTEMLTYAVPGNEGNTATMQLQWGTMVIPITISVDVGATVTEDLRQQLSGLPGFTARNYALAVNWMLQNNVESDLTAQWIDRAMQGTPDFLTRMLAARVAESKGNTKEAKELREGALKIATNAERNAYGYSLLQQGKVKEALPVFKTNAELNPTDPNVWDSLGEAYAMADQKDEAIKAFKKSLSMNPPDMVRENSEKWLKKLQQ